MGHWARPEGDTYLTPRWALAWLLDIWAPLPGTVIYDPCAGGWNGWSIGGAVAAAHGRQALLADIDPMCADFDREDYLEAVPPPFQPFTIITNPPYGDLIEPILRKALVDCGEGGEVMLKIPYLWLTAVDRAADLTLPSPADIYQPPKRLEFELVPEDALARVAFNEALKRGEIQGKPMPVKKSAISSTGWVVGSPGGAHAWVRFVPGHVGPARWHRPPVLERHLSWKGSI